MSSLTSASQEQRTDVMSYRRYMETHQDLPMTSAKKQVFDGINSRVTAIFLDSPLNNNVRWTDLIVEVPKILATDAFLKEVHDYVYRLFADKNLGDSHVCISDSGRVLEFHSNQQRPRQGTRHPLYLGQCNPASSCKKECLHFSGISTEKK